MADSQATEDSPAIRDFPGIPVSPHREGFRDLDSQQEILDLQDRVLAELLLHRERDFDLPTRDAGLLPIGLRIAPDLVIARADGIVTAAVDAGLDRMAMDILDGRGIPT